jgi:ABC-type nickel/cobalt efflux system permease component RcnA
MKPGTVLLTLALLAILALAVWGLAAAWGQGGDVQMSVHAYIAIAIAAVGTAALGGGLMWLAFYSSRKGWDDIDRKD